jgi:hypothetical protein
MRRSIVLDIVRATRRELRTVEELDPKDIQTQMLFNTLCEHMAYWAHNHQNLYVLKRHQMPRELATSPLNAWRPLISIADACQDGEISREAREAAVAMSGYGENPKVMCLADTRKVFRMPPDQWVHTTDPKSKHAHLCDRPEQLSSATLVSTMITLSPIWAAWRGEDGTEPPRPMTPNASLVGRWVQPHTIWPTPRTKESRSCQGYKLKDFEQHPKFGNLFERYCPECAEAGDDEEEARPIAERFGAPEI